MKKNVLCLFAACLMLFSAAAASETAVPDFGTFDPEVLRSLTWTEGTPYYDYVLFSYDDDGDPMDSYSISAVLPDMTQALTLDAGGHTLTVRPYVMASGDIAVPVLGFVVSDTEETISSAVLRAGDLTVTCGFSASPDYTEIDREEGTSYAYALNIGSNLFTLLGILADGDGAVTCTVTLADGTVLTASFPGFPDPGTNPFRWLDLCLKECALLDGDRCLQESLRLYNAQYLLHFTDLPEVTLEGAKWISDLADSVSAYPIKLEYAEETDFEDSFTVGVINYSGTFGSRSSRAAAAAALSYYCLDAEGNVVPFADGSVLRTVEAPCPLAAGEGAVVPIDVPLPEGTAKVMAAISRVTWSEGAVQTVPDRDLVFVEYDARTVFPEKLQEENISL